MRQHLLPLAALLSLAACAESGGDTLSDGGASDSARDTSAADTARMDVASDRGEDVASSEAAPQDVAPDLTPDAPLGPDADAPPDAPPDVAPDVATDTVVPCPLGQTRCAGLCVDLMTSSANCGSCGAPCAAGMSCTAGLCTPVCRATEMLCGAPPACVDTRTSNANCGSCGRSCAAGTMCSSGTCASTCLAPNVVCTSAGGSMSCVNLQSDNSNCGTCNRACPSGQSCVTGSCTVVCSVGQTNCGSACVDTQTSNSNCGACGTTCSGGTSCLAGRCSCPTGQTLCSAACVNTQTSNSHCGACGVACGAGTSCVAGSCRPANDDRANAQALTLTAAELTVTGTTVGATPDGPTDCGGALNNVWYSVTLGAAEVLYVDTAGSAYDTRISLVSSAGVTVANSCNDDAFCTTGGFTNSNQSRTAALLSAGTYYLNVSGFSASAVGAFTLHVQHLPRTVGSFFYDTPLTGSNSASTVLVGASSTSGTCGGTASGEDVRWFLTCGAQMQFFSLCRSDTVAGVMATYSRRIGTTNYDPAMYLRSAQTGAEVACNDDGTTMGATNCAGTGTGADTLNFGSRLNNVVAPRGLNAVFVDERAGGTGMTYTLVYTVR